MAEVDGDAFLVDEVPEDIFGDAGFEGPHGGIGSFELGGSGLAPAVTVEVILFGFEIPGGVFGVVLRDAVVELARGTADGGLIADISCAESAAAEPAQMESGFEQDDRVTHAGGLDCGDHAGGGAAIDADIDLELAGGCDGGGDERESCECRAEASA